MRDSAMARIEKQLEGSRAQVEWARRGHAALLITVAGLIFQHGGQGLVLQTLSGATPTRHNIAATTGKKGDSCHSLPNQLHHVTQ